MSNRLAISLVISMMVNAVLFGIGAVAVLSMPNLAKHASSLLPIVITASFLVAPFIAWRIAPQMRAKTNRTVVTNRRDRYPG